MGCKVVCSCHRLFAAVGRFGGGVRAGCVRCGDVSGRLCGLFPVEGFELRLRIAPRRFAGGVDQERSPHHDDTADDEYREPYGIAKYPVFYQRYGGDYV